MYDSVYASHVFRDRFNSFFGPKASWSSIPKELTDSTAQRDVVFFWTLEEKYSEKIHTAVKEFNAACTLDIKVNHYFDNLVGAVRSYKTFIANLEAGSGYDFSKVTAWPYTNAENIIKNYNSPS